MTEARQRARMGRLRALAGGAVALLVCALAPDARATTERIVVDALSGLALNGFDPVAYFTDGAAVPGRGEFELVHAGAIFRFRNAGNRAAFARDPDVYAPRFGGYDPIALAREAAVAGHPLIFAIDRARLYLFSTDDHRAQFIARPDEAITAAERGWARVQRQLAP